MQLQPPARFENFTKPPAPGKTAIDADIEHVMTNHKLMAGLLAQALACNQTKVFNMLFSDTASNLRRSASSDTHHTLTHEEPVNPKLGYQENVAWFAAKLMVACRDFVDALAGIKEGDGTLLDNTLLFAHSDCSIAKSHAVEGIPMIVIGGAQGRINTGYHKAAAPMPPRASGFRYSRRRGFRSSGGAPNRWTPTAPSPNSSLSDCAHFSLQGNPDERTNARPCRFYRIQCDLGQRNSRRSPGGAGERAAHCGPGFDGK